MANVLEIEKHSFHRLYPDYLKNEESYVKIECGSILLSKRDLKISFSCTFCSVELEDLTEFLRHSLLNHMGLTASDISDILSELVIPKKEPSGTIENEADVYSNKEDFLDLEHNSQTAQLSCRMPNETMADKFIEKFKNFVSNSNSDKITEPSCHDRPDYDASSNQSSSENDVNSMVIAENGLSSEPTESFEIVIVKPDELVFDANAVKEINRRAVSTKTPFTCTLCDKTFVRRDYLNIHMNRHHELKPYVCEFCGARFPDSSNWKVHRHRHLGIKPHSCTHCDKSFTSSTELKQHNRYHTGERPFTCKECEKSFRCAALLTAHRRRHTNDRRYVCATCGKRFFELKLLRDHEISHSSERPFVCEICEMRFSRRKAMREHTKLHSDIKQYACKLCSKTFAQCAGLHSHMKTHFPRKTARTKNRQRKDF